MYIIAGQYRHRRLTSPKGLQTKPTMSSIREAVFNICQNSIEKSSFLDLYAGSGAMGFEALSRGAGSVVFVDSSRESVKCLRENAALLSVQRQIEIFSSSVMSTLNILKTKKRFFDIIYADPPYRQTDLIELIQCIDTHQLLASGGILFIEEAVDAAPDLDHLMGDLINLSLKSSRRYGNTLLLQFCN
jgi:16S rRNA (guanine966-N2)-methyltransferase